MRPEPPEMGRVSKGGKEGQWGEAWGGGDVRVGAAVGGAPKTQRA